MFQVYSRVIDLYTHTHTHTHTFFRFFSIIGYYSYVFLMSEIYCDKSRY